MGGGWGIGEIKKYKYFFIQLQVSIKKIRSTVILMSTG